MEERIRELLAIVERPDQNSQACCDAARAELKLILSIGERVDQVYR